MEQEKYPDVAVMEQQVIATKEHATETVESKRTRYKTGESFVVKLGSALMSVFLGIRNKTEKKEQKAQVEEKVEKIDTNKQKKKNKKKKKKE